MTENLESGLEVVSESLPTPTFKDTSTDSHVSNIDPKEVAKQVAEILRPDFEKMVQSTKDKRIAKLEKAVGGLAELEELGVSIPENVKQEMRLRELEARIEPAPKPASQGSGAVEAGTWSKIIDEVGLDVKSTEVIELLRGEYRNLDHFEAEANRLKRRLDKAPTPSSETAPALIGKTVSGGDDLMKEYEKEVEGLHGMAVIEKKMKFRKRGLNID